ncbi:MAG: hypothetical protein WA294_16120 [Acidobacteriaceae bacterium]
MIAARLRVPSFALILCLCCCLILLLAAGAALAQTGSFPSGAVNLGSVAVNTGTPTIATLTFTFTTGGTIQAPAVVTQGAPNLDFTDAGTGTCTTNGTSHSYNANDTCTVIVRFMAKGVGSRYGAAEIFDNAGNVLGTGYVQGTGVGPQITYSPGQQSTIGNGLSRPTWVAVNGSGAVYITDLNNDRVLKETPSGGSYIQSTVADAANNGITFPDAVAVDGNGDLYIADARIGRVLKETPSGGSYIQSTVADAANNGVNQPQGVAVDGSGDVYIANSGDGRVLMETPSGAAGYTQSVVVGGLNDPDSVAVDSSGNVYIADFYTSEVLKETPSAGTYTQSTVGSGLNEPYAVAADWNGNLYISNIGTNSTGFSSVVKETLLGGSYIQSILADSASNGLNTPWGIAVDGSGNVYLSDSGNNRVLKEDLAAPPSLTFAPTPNGSTSSDSPQTVTLTNNGNAPLSFPVPDAGNNPGISTDFVLNSDVGSACPLVTASSSGPGALTAGASCLLSISFEPEAPASGNVTGALQLTDNNLNAASPSYAAQTLALSGSVESPGPPSMTTPAPGSTLPGSTVTFTWNPGYGPSAFMLQVGTTGAGSSNIYSGGSTTATSVTVSNIPSDSRPLYVQLSYEMGTTWSSVSYTYTESSGPPFGAMAQPIDATTRATTVAQGDSVLFTGWAADPQMGAPVSQVSILIDGTAVGNATLGLGRPDVVAKYNNFSYYNSGWTFTWAAASLSVGSHQVTAVISDSLGLTTQLRPMSFTVTASPSYGPPFGAVGQAIDAATRSTTVATGDDLLVTGWAADPHDGAPVSSVSILVDGATVGRATLGIADAGVATMQNNPLYLNSGWTFTSAAAGLSVGTHTVSATAADSLGNSASLGSRTITVAASSPDGPPFGSLDKAMDATTGQTTVSRSDNLLVEGWAADVHDGAPVSQVSILIDGTAAGNATLGTARHDVAKALGLQYTNSGWKFTMAASSLSAGTHTVTAVATDLLGLSAQFQIREITVTP